MFCESLASCSPLPSLFCARLPGSTSTTTTALVLALVLALEHFLLTRPLSTCSHTCAASNSSRRQGPCASSMTLLPCRSLRLPFLSPSLPLFLSPSLPLSLSPSLPLFLSSSLPLSSVSPESLSAAARERLTQPSNWSRSWGGSWETARLEQWRALRPCRRLPIFWVMPRPTPPP
jgi:hypothetical protein